MSTTKLFQNSPEIGVGIYQITDRGLLAEELRTVLAYAAELAEHQARLARQHCEEEEAREYDLVLDAIQDADKHVDNADRVRRGNSQIDSRSKNWEAA